MLRLYVVLLVALVAIADSRYPPKCDTIVIDVEPIEILRPLEWKSHRKPKVVEVDTILVPEPEPICHKKPKVIGVDTILVPKPIHHRKPKVVNVDTILVPEPICPRPEPKRHWKPKAVDLETILIPEPEPICHRKTKVVDVETILVPELILSEPKPIRRRRPKVVDVETIIVPEPEPICHRKPKVVNVETILLPDPIFPEPEPIVIPRPRPEPETILVEEIEPIILVEPEPEPEPEIEIIEIPKPSCTPYRKSQFGKFCRLPKYIEISEPEEVVIIETPIVKDIPKKVKPYCTAALRSEATLQHLVNIYSFKKPNSFQRSHVTILLAIHKVAKDIYEGCDYNTAYKSESVIASVGELMPEAARDLLLKFYFDLYRRTHSIRKLVHKEIERIEGCEDTITERDLEICNRKVDAIVRCNPSLYYAANLVLETGKLDEEYECRKAEIIKVARECSELSYLAGGKHKLKSFILQSVDTRTALDAC